MSGTTGKAFRLSLAHIEGAGGMVVKANIGSKIDLDGVLMRYAPDGCTMTHGCIVMVGEVT